MKKIVVLIGFMIVTSTLSFSQPIFVPVQNVAQQNPAWCWAAVTEQILKWKKNKSPKQCELVSEFSNDVNQNCCLTPAGCNAPGSLQQVQLVFNQFGIKYSELLPMPNARSLYSIINDNHAVILFLQSSRTVGHCIVIVGLDSTDTGTTVYINDPTGTYGQAVSLDTILSLWSAAIAI